jgi:hypothetical protein
MPIPDYDITELKRAYEVLGVPFSASAFSVKQAYRQIATQPWLLMPTPSAFPPSGAPRLNT